MPPIPSAPAWSLASTLPDTAFGVACTVPLRPVALVRPILSTESFDQAIGAIAVDEFDEPIWTPNTSLTPCELRKASQAFASAGLIPTLLLGAFGAPSDRK